MLNSTLNKIFPYLLYSVFFIPLLFTGFTLFPWHYGKTVIFQMIIELLLVGTVLAGRKWIFSRRNILDIGLWVLTLLLIVSSVWGVNFLQSFWGNQSRADGLFAWLHFLALYYLLRSFIQTEAQWTKVWVINGFVACLIALSAVFQGVLPLAWQGNFGPRLAGLLGNPAFLASYLSLAIGISALAALKTQGTIRWFMVINTAFLSVVLFLTGTRGAMIGFVAGVLALLVGLILSLPDAKKKIWSGAALVALVGCVGLATVGVAMKFGGGWRIFTSTSGTTTRLMAWKIAGQGIAERPWGWGMGNYQVLFDSHFNPQFLDFTFAETVWDKPHNRLLKVAVGGGVASAVVYVGILAAAVYYVVRKNSGTGTGRELSLGPVKFKEQAVMKSVLLGTGVAYFVQNLFFFDTTNSLLLFVVYLAFIASQYGPTVFRQSSPQEQLSFFGRRVELVVRGVAAVIVLFSLYQWNFVPLRQSYYAQAAVESLRPKYWAPWAEKALDIPAPYGAETGIFLAQKLVEFHNRDFISDPNDVEQPALRIARFLHGFGERFPDHLAFPLWEGQVYLVLAQRVSGDYFVLAEETLKRAVSIAPQKQEVWFVLGRIYLMQKKFDLATTVHEHATAIDSEVAISHWYLGLIHAAAGKNAGAIQSIETAKELGYSLTPEQELYLVDLYVAEKQYAPVIAIYESFKNQHPDNVNWYVRLATAYAMNGNKPEALATVEEALRLDPTIKPRADQFIQQYDLK